MAGKTDTTKQLIAAQRANPDDTLLPGIIADSMQDAGDDGGAALYRSGLPRACLGVESAALAAGKALADALVPAFASFARAVAPLLQLPPRPTGPQ